MMMSRLFSACALACLLSAPFSASAWAHKVIASVYAEGDVIAGEIGFSNGDMAPDAVVEVFDPAGNRLGEARTDADGAFTFRPSQKVPHVFRSNLGAGHVAEVTMEVEDLPAMGGAVAQGAAPASTAGVAVVASSQGAPASALSMDEQEKILSGVVQKQLLPLRRELAAYKEKNDIQSILGGIGYIFGLFGLGFYIAARRKLAQVPTQAVADPSSHSPQKG